MGNLYFISAAGERRLVKSNISQDDVFKAIKEYVITLNPKFVIHYIRSWCENSVWRFDIGSYSEFFEYDGEIIWKSKSEEVLNNA